MRFSFHALEYINGPQIHTWSRDCVSMGTYCISPSKGRLGYHTLPYAMKS